MQSSRRAFNLGFVSIGNVDVAKDLSDNRIARAARTAYFQPTQVTQLHRSR